MPRHFASWGSTYAVPARLAACYALLGMSLGCLGDLTGPGGGGRNSDPRACPTEVQNNAEWSSNGLTFHVSEPPGCPYVLKPTWPNSIQYAATLTMPKTSKLDGAYDPQPNVMADAWSTYHILAFIGNAWEWFAPHPSDPARLRVQVSFTGWPSNYTHPNDPTITRDSLRVEVSDLKYGYPRRPSAYKILPGRIDGVAQSVTGPSSAHASASRVWRAIPNWDTTAYKFRWLVNGQEIAGATGAQLTHAFPAGGTYQLANVARRADWSADTVTTTVKVAPTTPMVHTAAVSASGFAYLAWNAAPGADSYRVYRQLHTQGSWHLWRTVTALSFEDIPTQVSRHHGSSLPPSGTPWVKYKVIAVHSGLESIAEYTNYFILSSNEPQPESTDPPVDMRLARPDGRN